MRKIVVYVLAIALAVACSAPVNVSGPTSSGTSLDLTKPGAVIKNLSVGTVTLPKSLQDGSTNAGANVSRSVARAAGDITTLTSLTAPSLKGEGYLDFRQTVDRASVAKIFLDALKTMPSVADGSLPINKTIDTGTIQLQMTSTVTIDLTKSGRLSTSLSGDGQTLYIYWALSYPDTSKATGPYTNPQQMFDSAPRIILYMYFEVKKSGAVSLYVDRPLEQATGHYMNFWSQYDPSTGNNVEAEDANWSTSVDTNLTIVKPLVGGGFSIYRNFTGSWTHESMGYADDQYGGIVSKGTDNYDDGSGTPTDHAYMNVEYYDGNGDMIYRGYGETGRNSSNWNWRFDAASSTNLYAYSTTKPSGFTYRQTYQGGTTVSEYSVDGTTWTPLTLQGWRLVFHDSSKDQNGTWTIQPGDADYWCDNYQSDFNAVTGTWTCVAHYFKAYEVPQPETYFGQSFYVNKTYPLKVLLPLKAQYATGFEVTQKEGTTYYNWLGTDGKWNSGTSAPAGGSYQENSLYHWTHYDYWLENKGYVDGSGVKSNSNSTLDSDKGDVSLQLENLQVYSWNSALGQEVQSQAPAFSTYQSDLPPYFSLSAAKLDAVAATKAKLEALYAQRDSQTVAGLLSGFSAKMSTVRPLFPDMTGY